MLLRSNEALSDPRCLLELYTAITADIPIVLLACSRHKGRYDAAAAVEHLLHLDSSLSPAAVGVLESHNVPVLHAAYVLAASIPNCISVPFNSVGNEAATRAAVTALVGAMQRSQPVKVIAAADFDPSMLCAGREERDKEAVKRGAACESQRDRMSHTIERYPKLEAALARKKAQLEMESPQLVQDLLRKNESHVQEIELQGRAIERLTQAVNVLEASSEEALRAEIKALQVENKALKAENKFGRHEVAELKAALLAGTGIECEDDIGILGGMFICKSKSSSCIFLFSTCSNSTYRANAHTQSIPTRSAASLARGNLAPSIL